MFNKVFLLLLLFSGLMLTGCETGASRTSSGQQSQEPVHPLNSRSDIKAVQQGLKSKGYNPGPVDGFMGKKTSNAIRQFQKNEGYPVDGLATTRLLAQLQPGYKSSGQKSYDDSIVGQSTAQSAAAGAVIGGVLAVVTGHKDDAVKGAAAGAVIGGAADVAVNAYRVNQAETEHQLNISIDQLRRENEELKRNIDDAKELIREDRVKIKQIQNQLKQQQLTKKQAQKKYKQLAQNRQSLQTTYNELLKKQKQWQQYANAPGATNDVINEVNKLNAEIASLRTQLDELDQLRSISITG